jgi:hypothetical protein
MRGLSHNFCLRALFLPVLASAACGAEEPGAAKPSSDWPCKQVLVREVSLPAVWSGPSIEGVKWQDDPAVLDVLSKISVRRTPIDEAQKTVEDFAQKTGAGKKESLVRLFAGLFDRLNAERGQVINGLERFGRKQKDLAAKIRAEAAKVHEQPGSAETPSPSEAAQTEKLQWDIRIFEDRRKALSFVCEAPITIEQRLFSLARVIEQNLD